MSMPRDEIETLIAQLAAQYQTACEEEIEALRDEVVNQHAFDDLEARLLLHAYETGAISGKNAEIRKAQSADALQRSQTYVEDRDNLAGLVIARKAATMYRVGVENEWKTWRAWLYSQGGSE